MINELIAGDTLQFNTSVPDYPASESWTLSYKLVPRTSGSVISFSASADGDYYTVEVGSTTTAAWTAGEYSWAAYVTKTGERHTVDSGACTIKPDPATATTLDSRTHNQIALDAIKAVMQSRATKDQQEYMIAGRKLVLTPLPELIKLLNFYEARVAGEQAAENLRNGINVPSVIQVRM